MSNPHSPFPVGPVPRSASARAANFAACFFERTLGLCNAQHAWMLAAFGGAAVFCEAIGICATATHALIANVRTAAPHRQIIFFFLFIFRLRRILSCEIIVERQPIPRAPRRNYKLCPLSILSLSKVAPSLNALYDAFAQKNYDEVNLVESTDVFPDR